MPPILIAGLTGLFSGLLLSIPVGPVNLTIMNEGARRGFKFAVHVGLGAALMETIYCSIAFTGFAGFFGGELVRAAMKVGSFFFMIILGLKFLLSHPDYKTAYVGGRLEKRMNPHSAFMTGFVRVMGNPGVLLNWIVLGATFISHEWVLPNLACKAACIFGVAAGNCAWFFGVGYAVSRGYKKFSERTLLRMERGSGIGLLLLGVGIGCQIIWELARAARSHGM